MKRHLIQMVIAGGVVLAALVAFGVSPAGALPYALLLACPLMMIFMMRGMNHDSGVDHSGCGHDHSRDATESSARRSESPTPFPPRD